MCTLFDFCTAHVTYTTSRISWLNNCLSSFYSKLCYYSPTTTFCVKLLRQSKKSYYSKLDPKVVSDNKQFWKTVKPLFSNKIHGTPCITLLEDNVVVSDDTNVAEIFNEYFVDIAKGLGIAKKHDPTNMDGSSEDTLQTTIERFRCHSSVAKIGTTVCCL